jgi:hypothetical protein
VFDKSLNVEIGKANATRVTPSGLESYWKLGPAIGSYSSFLAFGLTVSMVPVPNTEYRTWAMVAYCNTSMPSPNLTLNIM